MRPVPALLPALAAVLALAACVPPVPQPPMWPPERYAKVLVLPVRMEVSTGAPPFTTPDTELSNRQGGLAQQALTLMFRERGYETVNPFDANERLGKDRELTRAVAEMAARAGLLGASAEYGAAWTPGQGGGPPSSPSAVAPEDGGEGLRRLAREFGADLLVIAAGTGEFHGFGESLVTALLSKGRQEPSPSWQRLTVVVVDPEAGGPVARLSAHPPWTEDLAGLARALSRDLRRIPRRP